MSISFVVNGAVVNKDVPRSKRKWLNTVPFLKLQVACRRQATVKYSVDIEFKVIYPNYNKKSITV